MNEKIHKYLYDIKFAIDEVDSYFTQKEKRFENYSKDILLKRAVERDLEIIGESINRILSIDPEFPIQNARKIVGLRNQIIHEPGLKTIFIAKLCVVLNFCILINNGLTPVQKFKTP